MARRKFSEEEVQQRVDEARFNEVQAFKKALRVTLKPNFDSKMITSIIRETENRRRRIIIAGLIEKARVA